MQISSVTAGYSDLPALSKQEEAIERSGAKPSDAGRPKMPATPGRSAALGETLARYDVTDISPTEFSEMIQKLYESGAISEQEMQQLAAVRLDLDAAGVEPDESIDLLEFYTERIDKLNRLTDDSEALPKHAEQFSATLNRLDWIEKFALVQSAPGAAGLDAVV